MLMMMMMMTSMAMTARRRLATRPTSAALHGQLVDPVARRTTHVVPRQTGFEPAAARDWPVPRGTPAELRLVAGGARSTLIGRRRVREAAGAASSRELVAGVDVLVQRRLAGGHNRRVELRRERMREGHLLLLLLLLLIAR